MVDANAASEPRRAVPKRVLGWMVIVGLLLVNTYRASTQALIGDEALTYHWFLRGSWSGILLHYNANNHVLYSLLAKASISLFGVSELTLRLPALFAGALYFAAAYRFSDFLFSRAPAFVFSLLLLVLNPLVLDFLCCARGYGMALAAFLWALYQSTQFLAGRRTSLVSPGVWCALSVCANLTLAAPVAGIFAVLAIHTARFRRPARTFIAMLAVFAGLCGCILWLPLRGAQRSQFYAGAGTISESFLSLVNSYVPTTSFAFCQWAAGGLLLSCLAVAAARPRRPEILPVAVLGLSLACLWGGHLILNVPLPANRTGLYLIPLFTISVVTLFDGLPRRAMWNGGRAMIAVLLVSALFIYVKNFRVDHYSVWWYDAETKHALGDLKRLAGRDSLPRPIPISVTIWQYPSLEFYRLLEPESFTARTIQYGCVPYDFYFEIPRDNAAPAGDGGARRTEPGIKDFYILHGADLPYLEKCGLAEIKRYPMSNLVLAASPSRRLAARLEK